MFDLGSNTIQYLTPPAWWRPFSEFERKDFYFWHSFKFLHRLTPRPHVSVFVWNQRFIFSVWPIVHTYSVETVTKNASFKKRSPEGRVLKTPYSFEWMKTEVLFEKDYVELLDTRECERSQRGFFGKEEKLSVFQNYPATCGLYRHNKCASSTESIILIAPGAEAAFQVRKRIWTNTKRKFVVAMWSNVREFFWIY